MKILTLSDLKGLSGGDWLIKNVLRKNGLAVLYGDPGTCKTFLALDISLSLAFGLPWAGFRRAEGQVVYVLTEGGAGINSRIAAWRIARGVTGGGDDMALVLNDIQLTSRQNADKFIDAVLDKLSPDLIVFDTLARCFVGGDENSAKDMGQLVDNVQYIQREMEAAVLLVHHTTKRKTDVTSPSQERGSSALRGATDTMIRVTMNGKDQVRVDLDRQKDGPEWKKLLFRKEVVELGTDAEGDPVTSLVLISDAAAVTQDKITATPKHPKMLASLVAAPGHTLSNAEWYRASRLKDTTFRRNRDALQQKGLVKQAEEGRWTLTPAGLAAATPPPSISRGGDPDLGPAAATPPLGGGGSGDGDYEGGYPDDYWPADDDDPADEEVWG